MQGIVIIKKLKEGRKIVGYLSSNGKVYTKENMKVLYDKNQLENAKVQVIQGKIVVRITNNIPEEQIRRNERTVICKLVEVEDNECEGRIERTIKYKIKFKGKDSILDYRLLKERAGKSLKVREEEIKKELMEKGEYEVIFNDTVGVIMSLSKKNKYMTLIVGDIVEYTFWADMQYMDAEDEDGPVTGVSTVLHKKEKFRVTGCKKDSIDATTIAKEVSKLLNKLNEGK